jgi:DNA ligase-1
MFKPLLAPRDCPESKPGFLQNLPYPLYVSPKYDGIRALPKEGSVKSRSYKDLPSWQVQDLFSPFQDLDGEIIVGNPMDFDVYNRTQSHVMSFDKPADNISMFAFDWTREGAANIPFEERLQETRRLVDNYNLTARKGLLVAVPHKIAENLGELLEIENEWVGLGFEGVMMRGRRGRYKHGRATYNEGIIYKLKRFIDDEGVIEGFEEAMINMNELTEDELGYAKRSDHQENKVPAGRVGKFWVRYQGERISVAPGNFTHAELIHIWNNRSKYAGKILKFRYFGHGVKNLPRHPRAIGFRDKMDM